MDCVGFVDHWFFVNLLIGMWDGFTAVISLVLSLFWNVEFYSVCYHQVWFYNLGFICGLVLGMIIGFNSRLMLIIGLIIALIVKVIVLIAVPVMWGVGIGIGCAVVFVAFWFLGGKRLFAKT